MSDHLSKEVLSFLAAGVLPSGSVRPLLEHFLNCPACYRNLRRSQQDLKVKREHAYDSAVSRVLKRVLKISADTLRSKKLLLQLERKGLQALPVIRNGWEIPAVDALLHRSWALRHENPSQMVELIEFAKLPLRRLSPEVHGKTRVADLSYQLYTELGNAYRIVDRLEDAEEAFDQAAAFYFQGSQDDLSFARLLDFRASLYRSKREIAAANNYLRLSYSIYRQHGQRHMAGRALIAMAISIGYAGDPERAIKNIRRGLSMIHQDEDRELALGAIHNHIWFLVDCGRFDEAQKTLFLNRYRYKDTGRLSLLKLRWLESRLDTCAWKLQRAEEGFREVSSEFMKMGLCYDAALATLDLAAVVLRTNRMDEAHDLVFGATEIFNSLKISRPAMSAILFLRESFKQHIATLTLLEEATAFFRRAQYDRNARFVPTSL